MSKPYQNPDTLEQLYVEKELSQREIGDRFDVDHTTIGEWLNRHEIERPEAASYSHQHEYPIWNSGVDNVHIHQLLAIAEGENPHKVFSDNHVIHHRNGIKWANWGENIELMTHSEHMSHHQEERYGDKPWWDRKVLWNLHVEEGMSIRKIAEELGCIPGTIQENLHKSDIPVRNQGGKYDHEPHTLRKW